MLSNQPSTNPHPAPKRLFHPVTGFVRTTGLEAEVSQVALLIKPRRENRLPNALRLLKLEPNILRVSSWDVCFKWHSVLSGAEILCSMVGGLWLVRTLCFVPKAEYSPVKDSANFWNGSERRSYSPYAETKRVSPPVGGLLAILNPVYAGGYFS
jgi:hypothetical protein